MGLRALMSELLWLCYPPPEEEVVLVTEESHV